MLTKLKIPSRETPFQITLRHSEQGEGSTERTLGKLFPELF